MSTPVARGFAVRATGLAYNLVNPLRQLALPPSNRSRNLTVREKLAQIGAKVVTHTKCVLPWLGEAKVPASCSRPFGIAAASCGWRTHQAEVRGV